MQCGALSSGQTSQCTSGLLAFRVSSCLPLLRKHTMPTRLVPLSADLVEYWIEDGVWIPEHHPSSRMNLRHSSVSLAINSWNEEDPAVSLLACLTLCCCGVTAFVSRGFAFRK